VARAQSDRWMVSAGEPDLERTSQRDLQRALLNILDDSDDERVRLRDAQRALLNILDDLDVEKARVDRVNQELSMEIAERERAQQALRLLTDQLEQMVRSRTAALEASIAELEAFTYSIAHDLRAPLRAITGFVDVLAEDHLPDLDEEACHVVDEIRGAAVRMGQMIDGLLSLAHVGRQSLSLAPVGPDVVARRAWQQLSADAHGREVELTVHSMPEAVADAALLEQVYANLLSNALKYTRGAANVRIEVGARESGGDIVFFVRDNGIGFDMRYANQIFGVFQRLHTRDRYEGSGIGLAIVQRIVDRHGGRAWAEGRPGAGSTFFFTLGGDLTRST
jgi:light-regulated signal transduction histidine kinase (bacteriophytochrome)